MRHPSRLILILAAVLALPLVARGESTPVTQPWSLLGQVPFVLRFTPQTAAPVTALRARLVLQGVNVSHLELLSIAGLPQVLEVAASLGTLTAWELLLGAPLAKDVEVTLLLRLHLPPDFDGAVLSMPEAEIAVQYALATRPEAFYTQETIAVPFNASTCHALGAGRALQASLLSATTVQMQFRLDMSAAAGDVLLMLPLHAIHYDFQLPDGSQCPELAVDFAIPGGGNASWDVACRFRRLGLHGHGSNALEFTMGSSFASLAVTLSLSLPSPVAATAGAWLAMLTDGLAECDVVLVDAPPSLIAPQGYLVTTSSSIFMAAAALDVTLMLMGDLPPGGEVVLKLVDSAPATLLACDERTEAFIPTRLLSSLSVSASSDLCHVRMITRWAGSGSELKIRLSVMHGENATAVAVESRTELSGEVSNYTTLQGQYYLTEAQELQQARLYPTGLAELRPSTFLITFQTAVESLFYAPSQPGTAVLTARPPPVCSQGCAAWEQRMPGSAAGLGRACSQPAILPRAAPWCYCENGQGADWDFCLPEVVRLRLQLLDASRFWLRRASDGAKLQAVPEMLAVDCAEYLLNFAASGGSLPAPRRCWGDAMRTTGDEVFVDFFPGRGLVAGTSYSLEVTGEFRSYVSISNEVLELSVWSTSADGPFIGREFAKLRPSASSIPKSGTSIFAQQPTVNSVAAQLLDVNTTGNVSVGRFSFQLEPGSDSQQWLREGQSLDLFFLPLAAWDFRVSAGSATACASLRLDVANSGETAEAPSCFANSVGGAALDFQENMLTLVLGSGTVISPYAPGLVEVTLPLPSGGIFGTQILAACRYQVPAGQAAWHTASQPLQWAPKVASAGFVGLPQVEPGGNITADIAVISGLTLSGYAGAALHLHPPAYFRIIALEDPGSSADEPWARVVASMAATDPGEAVVVQLQSTTALYAGAEYFVRVVLVASAPSSGQREPWQFQVSGEAAPAVPFESATNRSAGILSTGSLGATISFTSIQANARTLITVYFLPEQVQGIFLRYLVLQAPRGFDFATAVSPGSCEMVALLSTPAHSQCQDSRAGPFSWTSDIATIVLPPLSRLLAQEYGFAVFAMLPSFPGAWVEEVNGRGTFALETQTEDASPCDTLPAIPGPDVFPSACAEASVRLSTTEPEQEALATLTFRPGAQHPSPVPAVLYLHVEAPFGYSWVMPVSSWSAQVARGPNSVAVAMPNLIAIGTCVADRKDILCISTTDTLTAMDEITITAGIIVPLQNPDVPQGSGELPSASTWHLRIASELTLSPGMAPASRWLGCHVMFEPPRRVRRIFAAAAEASNAVVGAENDITFSVTTVTEVPVGGAIVLVPPIDVFDFPNPCQVEVPNSAALSIFGLPLPESAGASCTSSALGAAVVLQLGALPANTYLFTVRAVRNLRTIAADDLLFQWQAYTVAAGTLAASSIGSPSVSFLDSPRAFASVSVLVAMNDAFIDTELLDLSVTGFTKGRGALNQVVICFQQSLASLAGQTLSVYIPDGFRLPWSDSNNCLAPDANTGVPPVNVADPFGRGGSPDPATFALFPSSMQVACATSPDGNAAFLTLSEGLVEISRFYAFRLVVQNADRSPANNAWRLQLGQQASLPIRGFTMQAFQQLAISASFAGAAQRIGQAPPNLLQVLFQPSVPVPSGGALQLTPPRGFELMASVPRTSRGVLVKASATCVGESIFLGVDYTFSQCQAACSQRDSCEFFRVGIGDRSGECIQESTGDGSMPCQDFLPDDSFSVYRVTPTGNCFRFLLTEDGAQRSDVDCSLEQRSALELGQGFAADPGVSTVAVFGLRVGAPAMAIEKLYVATLAVRNPTQTPEQSVWTLQSFSQTLLISEALLEDGSADGFALLAALDRLELQVLPEAEKHKAGAEVELSFIWAPSEPVIPASDVIEVQLPSWLQVSAAVCSSLRTPQSADYTLTACSLPGPSTLQFSITGPAEALAQGSRLDFHLVATNPDASAVAAAPRGSTTLVQLSHLRPVTSAVTGETLLSVVSASGSEAHAVQLAMPFLRMQQILPQFAVAGHFPTTLEVTFQVATPGADQVWIDTLSGGSPMDFASVQCTMAVDGGADAGTSPELFGQISCFPGGQIETETSDNRVTQQAQLRAEFVSTFLPDQRYTLKLELVRMGFLAGPVVAAVATSTASSSADASDFSQAFLLDRSSLEDQGDEQLYLAGQLVLQAPGSGSFVSLSATAEFGTSLFLAADRVHYLTLGFALQAALPKGGRLVLYPAAGLGVAADVVLGLAATNVRMSTALKDIGGADDVFQNSQRLSLPPPSYTARLDVLFQASGEVNESLIALPAEQPLSIQLRVQTRFVAAGSGWLLLTTLREDWSVDRQSVTNTNLEEWPGGPLPVVPSFDPRSTLVSASSTRRSALVQATFRVTPVLDMPAGSFLRVRAPSGFVWAADCVEGSGPGGLVEPGQCWRDSSEPSVTLLELHSAMQAKASYELLMQVLTPAMLQPPNRWELAALSLITPGPAAITTTSTVPPGLVGSPSAVNLSAEVVHDPRERHADVVPQQVIRLTGFQLSGLEARLQPLRQPEANGQLMLLSFRLALLLDELRLATLPLPLVLSAPQGVTVSCALSEQGQGGDALNYGSISVSWRLLATQQRSALLSRCSPQDASGDSSLLLELQAPPSSGSEAPGEWLALPIYVSSAQEETFASEQTWRLRVGDGLAEVRTLHTSPRRIVHPSSPPRASLAAALACTAFCAAVAGEHQELPAAAALAVDRGSGIRVQLALALPQAPPTRSSRLVASRLASAFRQGVRSSDFTDAAEAALVDFVRITAPAPLRWLDNCRVTNTSMISSARWRCLCYGSEAYVYTLGYTSEPALPLREVLQIQGVTLSDSAEAAPSVRLPFSSTWVASLFEDGALVSQQLMENHEGQGVLHLVSALPDGDEANETLQGEGGNTTAALENGTLTLPEDAVDLEECAEQKVSYFPCPVGMFAHGVRVVRLGGAGSWMDSLQLLCSQELDVGTNHTQWQTLAGTTGLAGNRQILSFTDAGENAEVEVLRCDERASSLLVGVRLALWRRRKAAGLAAACAAWSQVERIIAWDSEAHEELEPEVASMELETGANCTGLVPINGSERWASCQGMSNLKPCPDPEMCCCNEDFQYVEALGSCEPCAAGEASERPRRLCPPGTAVIGFYAGIASSEGSRHQAVGSDLLISTICSIRVSCGPLEVRHWAGDPSMIGSLVVARWDPPVQEAGDLELPGLANLGELQWWHYAAAGGALLLVLYCIYRCCRTSQSTVYGDVQTGTKSSWTTFKGAIKLPFQVIWRYLLRPIGSLVLRILEPIWVRVLRPLLRWMAATRVAKLLAGIARRLWRVLTCCCPCLRRLEKMSLRETLKAARDPMAASKTTRARVARQWELRRQLLSGTFDAQKAKDDLLGQLKRGEIDEKELGARQREIDELLAKSQAMTSKTSLKDRMKDLKSQGSLRPLSAAKSVSASKMLSASLSFARSASLREDGARKCCACCRRLPAKEEEEEKQDAAMAAAQQPEEGKEQAKRAKVQKEDDEEWEYFWEEDSEEEDFEDDQMVDVSPATTQSRGRSESLAFGPVASRTSGASHLTSRTSTPQAKQSKSQLTQ